MLPAKQRQKKCQEEAQNDGGRQRKVERKVAAADRDVAGETKEGDADDHQEPEGRNREADQNQQPAHLDQFHAGEEIPYLVRRRVGCV